MNKFLLNQSRLQAPNDGEGGDLDNIQITPEIENLINLRLQENEERLRNEFSNKEKGLKSKNEELLNKVSKFKKYEPNIEKYEQIQKEEKAMEIVKALEMGGYDSVYDKFKNEFDSYYSEEIKGITETYSTKEKELMEQLNQLKSENHRFNVMSKALSVVEEFNPRSNAKNRILEDVVNNFETVDGKLVHKEIKRTKTGKEYTIKDFLSEYKNENDYMFEDIRGTNTTPSNSSSGGDKSEQYYIDMAKKHIRKTY